MKKSRAKRMSVLLFACLFACLFVTEVQGQSRLDKIANLGTHIELDRSKLEVIYALRCYDPVCDETQEKDVILQVGDDVSKFWDYSIYTERKIIEQEGYRITRRRSYAIQDSVGYDNPLRTLYKDHLKGEYRGLDAAAGRYAYTEPYMARHWKLEQETKQIAQYLAKRATLDFRGRTWEVWYTEEIPIPEGPWKLDGLPGLVLEARSADGEYQYTLVAIRNKPTSIFKNSEEDDAYKNSRKNFYQVMANYHFKLSQTLEAKGLGATAMDGTPLTPVQSFSFYNPPELDLLQRPDPSQWVSTKRQKK